MRTRIAFVAGVLTAAALALLSEALSGQEVPPPEDACNAVVINNIPDGPILVVAVRQGDSEAVFEDFPIAPGQYLGINLDCDEPMLELWVAPFYDRREPVYRRATTPDRGKTVVWCLGPCPFDPRIGEPNDTLHDGRPPVLPQGLQPRASRAG